MPLRSANNWRQESTRHKGTGKRRAQVIYHAQSAWWNKLTPLAGQKRVVIIKAELISSPHQGHAKIRTCYSSSDLDKYDEGKRETSFQQNITESTLPRDMVFTLELNDG